MDPLSALIGGGASLIGGLMNTSSQQSINAANLQQAMWSAEGGYLPGLVANAGKAGLNPLAVLGSRGPNMAVQVGTQPGAGLQAAGQQISKASMEGFEADQKLKAAETERQEALTKQTNIDAAIRQQTLDDIKRGKVTSGPEPASATSWPGMFKGWEENNPLRVEKGGFLDRWFNPGSYFGNPSSKTIPSADWMRFMPGNRSYGVWDQ